MARRLPVAPASPTLMTALRSSVLLAPFGEELTRQVAAEGDWIALEAGETLLEQGSASDGLYVLVAGRLQALDPSAPDQPLNEVWPGETVGEMSVLTDDDRSATVRAVRDAVLVRL